MTDTEAITISPEGTKPNYSKYRTILPKLPDISTSIDVPKAPETVTESLSLPNSTARLYKCYHCDESYSSYRARRRHMQQDHGQQLVGTVKVFICSYCYSCWNHAERLEKHVSLNHTTKMFQCIRCKFRDYKCEGNLLRHYKKVHLDNTTKYFCGECDMDPRVILTHSDIEQHFLKKHNNTENVNPSPQLSDGNVNDDDIENIDLGVELLNELLQQEDVRRVIEYLFRINFKWDIDVNYENDNEVVMPMTEPNAAFPCPICKEIQPVAFKHAYALLKHLEKDHGGPKEAMDENNQQCPINNNAVPNQVNLHSCPYCAKMFNDIKNLRQHIRVVHTQYKRHICQLCDKQFSTLDHLKKHVLSQHQNERKYCCKICDKRFVQFCHLQQHIPIHTSDKKFACTTCNKRFWRRIDLVRHNAKNHLSNS